MQILYRDVDSEVTPLGELKLRRYTAESGESGYEILLDGSFLMASHGSHSERAMARLAFDRLSAPVDGLDILVGGLGAGHTLRAALDLPGTAAVVVVEIGAKVVQWNRRYFAETNTHAVDDPRVQVVVADLGDFIRRTPRRFHLALLDVDNGPGWLAAASNAGLYDPKGLHACRDALVPGGVLAVWSPKANPGFRSSLMKAFGAVEAVDTAGLDLATGEPGSTIYLGIA